MSLTEKHLENHRQLQRRRSLVDSIVEPQFECLELLGKERIVLLMTLVVVDYSIKVNQSCIINRVVGWTDWTY